MVWTPTIEDPTKPTYVELADAIATGVRIGQLPPGTRLPTQRALARSLGVTPGTIARGYMEAERRGLIEGRIGSGTFVREHGGAAATPVRVTEGSEVLDLSLNHPPSGPESIVAQALSAGLEELARAPDLSRLLALQPARGSERHRNLAAQWIGRRLPGVTADDVLICSGGQHALSLALAATTGSGDVLLTEGTTYSGLIQLTREQKTEVVGLDQDEYGLLPSALEAACRRHRPRALYCIPTLQNPTTAVMPAARRVQVAQILRQYDVELIEDDVYGILHGECDPARPEASPLPISALVPERSLYLTNAGKSLAPGLRIGFLKAPRHRMPELEQRIQDNCWSVAPLMAELTTRWIADGTADRIVVQRRLEARERQALATDVLGRFPVSAQPTGFHAWMKLPDPWTADDFVRSLSAEGVHLAPTAAFRATAGVSPHHVRLCLGATEPIGRLLEALEKVARHLEAGPRQASR